MNSCSDPATYRALEASRKLAWAKLTKEAKEKLSAAARETSARIAGGQG
jgi:hypothetical protein